MLKGIAQHYEELIPGDTQEAKESHLRADATLLRMEKLRLTALLQGYRLNLKPIGLEDSFKEGPRRACDNAPRLKIGTVMAEKAISRGILQRSRPEKAPGRVV